MYSDRIFLGAGGHVVALDAATGHELWRTRVSGSWGSGYVTGVALVEGRLFATYNGEITCLDPITGNLLWHNGLSGLGTGFVSVAAEDSNTGKAGHVAAANASAATASAAAAAAVAATAASSAATQG